MTESFQGIIDAQIIALVQRIESSHVASPHDIEDDLITLVQKLHANCQKPEVRARYDSYAASQQGIIANPETSLTQYPIDLDGYAQSFDPLQDEKAYWESWTKYGFVVGKGIISPAVCEASRERVRDIVKELSGGKCSIDDPKTHAAMPLDANGTPLISRGFFEIYHDDSLAQLRQAVRTYIHHAVIWGRADLWTTFDRYGVKLAGHKESHGLPLHVDQNPTVHPQFETVQGVLALTDCPQERGTFVAVPGSRQFFEEYAKLVHAKGGKYRGEYVELKPEADFAELLQAHAQKIPIRAGDIVSWDSRTTHCNSANISGEPRIVAYIAAGPARENNPEALSARQEAFRTGLGSNVRNARMHASMKPRYTDPNALARVRKPERLTALGELLYGQELYGKKISR